jgi:hypothetical protein
VRHVGVRSSSTGRRADCRAAIGVTGAEYESRNHRCVWYQCAHSFCHIDRLPELPLPIHPLNRLVERLGRQALAGQEKMQSLPKTAD